MKWISILPMEVRKLPLAFFGHRMEANIYEVSIQRESLDSLFVLKLQISIIYCCWEVPSLEQESAYVS